MVQESNTLPAKEQAAKPDLIPDVTLMGSAQEAVATEQPKAVPQAAPARELTVSIIGLDIWKKPIDEALLQTLAQLRYTHGLISDESLNSYLVWLINSDLATIIRDMATKRRG